MGDVVISGYYGFRNNGDDALLMSIISDLKSLNKDVEIVVLSKNPRETEKIYNVRAINRANIFSLIKEISSARLLISGGGTLIQDATSTKSLIYYLFVIRLGLLFKKKIAVYANGIGPLSKPINARRSAKVLNKVDIITLRDNSSFDELERIGVKNKNISVTADPTFGLNFSEDSESRTAVFDRFGIDREQKILCVSVRDCKKNSPGFTKELAAVCDYAAEKYGLYTVFFPMQPSVDLELTEMVQAQMKSTSLIIDIKYDTLSLLTLMSGVTVCIGMRLHTLIYAAVTATPLIGLAYDPKVSSFMKYVGQDSWCDVSSLSADELCNNLDEIMGNYSRIRDKLAKSRDDLKEKAYLNRCLVAKLLNEMSEPDGKG